MAITIIVKNDDGNQAEIKVELADDAKWEEKKEWENCFEHGRHPPAGEGSLIL